MTNECVGWWDSLSEDEQDSVAHAIELLVQFGPSLSRPHADTLRGSRFPNMKELRVQHEGRPYRLLYAFDPRRVALMLIGGDKTGDARWYDKMLPIAEHCSQITWIGCNERFECNEEMVRDPVDTFAR